MSDGAMIIIIFAAIIILPVIVVFSVIGISKIKREKKKKYYRGLTRGTVEDIKLKGLNHPWVITVSYNVNGQDYMVKETVKLKTETLRAGRIPIGQKKTFVMGDVKAGDEIMVRYDEKRPEKAIVEGNDGAVTG